jgi:hypothetical protein
MSCFCTCTNASLINSFCNTFWDILATEQLCDVWVDVRAAGLVEGGGVIFWSVRY